MRASSRRTDAHTCGPVDVRGDSRQRYRTAGAGVALEGDRAEEGRQRGGCSDGASERYAAEVRAQQVELRLREGKPGTGRQSGGVDDHKRPHVAAGEIGVRCAVEQFAIEVFGEDFSTRELRLGEPRQIGEELDAKLALHVALQEFGFEIAEESFPMDGVIGGDDAAAGNGIDDIDLVEQPSAPAADPELHVAQRFHRSVGQCRRPRASARQRQDDQHISRVVGIGFYALQPVSLARGPGLRSAR